eukprot:621894-Amphidinium_carterae.1
MQNLQRATCNEPGSIVVTLGMTLPSELAKSKVINVWALDSTDSPSAPLRCATVNVCWTSACCTVPNKAHVAELLTVNLSNSKADATQTAGISTRCPLALKSENAPAHLWTVARFRSSLVNPLS